MKTELLWNEPAKASTELLVVLAVDSAKGRGKDIAAEPALLSADKSIAKITRTILESGEFKAGSAETILLHAPEGLKAKRLLVVGVGKAGKVTIHDIRKA